MNHFHIVWSIFTNIQIFSLIHRYHLSTTPATIFSGEYFNTSRNFVQHVWLGGGFGSAATLARTNKRKWSLKKRKNQAKLNAMAEDFCFKKFVYIQDSPALCQPFCPNKPHTQTFLTLQSKWAREEELCLNNNLAFRGRNSTKFWITVIQMSSRSIHSTNFKITNLSSKFCIYFLKSWYFQIIECSPSSR